MRKSAVEHLVDLANLPPLTEAQRADVSALRDMRDEEIARSDIPLLTESFFENAGANPFFRPMKTSTTIRLDADVLAWFKSQGRGYQTRINAVLRRAMLEASISERG